MQNLGRSAVILSGLFAVLAGLVGCVAPESTQSCRTPETCTFAKETLRIGTAEFTVELAETPAQRAVGLMRRTDLCDSCGMLFVFPEATRVSFWMKNTLIPLDILYFNSDQELQQILPSIAPCMIDLCASYPSYSDQIRFALELPAGTHQNFDWRIGEKFYLR